MSQSHIHTHLRDGRWVQPFMIPSRMPGIPSPESRLVRDRQGLNPANHPNNHLEHVDAAQPSATRYLDSNNNGPSQTPATANPTISIFLNRPDRNFPHIRQQDTSGSIPGTQPGPRQANAQQTRSGTQGYDSSLGGIHWSNNTQQWNPCQPLFPQPMEHIRDAAPAAETAPPSTGPATLPPIFGMTGQGSQGLAHPPPPPPPPEEGMRNVPGQLGAPFHPEEGTHHQNRNRAGEFIRTLLAGTVGAPLPQTGRGAFRPMDSANAELRALQDRGLHDAGFRPPTPLAQSSQPMDAELGMGMGMGMGLALGLSPHAGFSERYEGNRFLQSNMSANIPADKNCSLFVTGLPADVTTTQLLAPISGMGRIFATHINPPEPAKGHPLSAAKIVFFERDAAHRFWRWANTHGYTVGGLRAHVIFNRIRSAESTEARNCSRVLMISGPPQFVNPGFLALFFKAKFVFQVDAIIQHGQDKDGNATIEYRFGSYRCQAQAAKMALGREFGDVITTYWGPDPCA